MRIIDASVYVTLPSALQEYIQFKSGHKLYLPVDNNREQYATVLGVVHTVGEKCLSDLRQGDEVLISYKVTADVQVNDDNAILKYNRVLDYDGDIVWQCRTASRVPESIHFPDGIDYTKEEIFAVKRNGKWQAIGGWTYMLPIEEQPAYKSEFLILPESMNGKIREGSATFVSAGEDIDAQEGDEVMFDKQYLHEYTLPDNTTAYFIKTQYVWGVYEQV